MTSTFISILLLHSGSEIASCEDLEIVFKFALHIYIMSSPIIINIINKEDGSTITNY